MNVRLLKQFVRLSLNEAAVTTTSANKAGLALATNGEDYVLYDPEFYLELINDVLTDMEAEGERAREEALTTLWQRNGMKAYMLVLPPNGADGPCWNAWTVGMSAAEHGFGPLLYDIVMNEKGALTSDRSVVSAGAANLWKYYSDSRQDVEKKRFDNIHDPQTPPPEDDCVIHSGHYNRNGDLVGTRDQLNYAYSLKHDVDASTLKKNHQEFCVDLLKLLKKFSGAKGLNASKVTDRMLLSGEKFFKHKYANKGE